MAFPLQAADISYNNKTSHLAAHDVQTAIDVLTGDFGSSVQSVNNSGYASGAHNLLYGTPAPDVICKPLWPGAGIQLTELTDISSRKALAVINDGVLSVANSAFVTGVGLVDNNNPQVPVISKLIEGTGVTIVELVDVDGNKALEFSATSVNVHNASGLGSALVIAPGTSAPILRKMRAGTNITITDDDTPGSESLIFDSTLVDVHNAAGGTGVALIASGASTNSVALNNVKAGSNITITDDLSGNLTIAASASGGTVTSVNPTSNVSSIPMVISPFTTTPTVRGLIQGSNITLTPVNTAGQEAVTIAGNAGTITSITNDTPGAGVFNMLPTSPITSTGTVKGCKAGTNITITDDGHNLTFAASGGGATSLQTAYNGGNTIDTTGSGVIITNNGNTSRKVFAVQNSTGTSNLFNVEKTSGGSVITGMGGVATGNNDICIGPSSSVGGFSNAVCLGSSDAVTADSGQCIGNNNTVSSSEIVCIGNGITASGNNSVCIGGYFTHSGARSVSLGYAAACTDTDAIAIGENASVTGTYGVAVGVAAVSAGNGCAIGLNATAGSYGQAFGRSCQATATPSLAMGYLAKASGTNSICVATTGSSEAAANYSFCLSTRSNVTNSLTDTGLICLLNGLKLVQTASLPGGTNPGGNVWFVEGNANTVGATSDNPFSLTTIANSVYCVKFWATGLDNATNASCVFEGVFKVGTNASNVITVSAITFTPAAGIVDAGLSGVFIDTASGGGGVSVNCNGKVGTSIHWNMHLQIVQGRAST